MVALLGGLGQFDTGQSAVFFRPLQRLLQRKTTATVISGLVALLDHCFGEFRDRLVWRVHIDREHEGLLVDDAVHRGQGLLRRHARPREPLQGGLRREAGPDCGSGRWLGLLGFQAELTAGGLDLVALLQPQGGGGSLTLPSPAGGRGLYVALAALWLIFLAFDILPDFDSIAPEGRG